VKPTALLRILAHLASGPKELALSSISDMLHTTMAPALQKPATSIASWPCGGLPRG
jgi:hypothetical protein